MSAATFISHEKLTKNRLVEVLFELRYDTKLETKDVINKIREAFKDSFFKEEKIDQQFIEFQVGPSTEWKPLVETTDEPADLVTFRLKDKDEIKLIQIGKGIIAYNLLRYDGFNSFRADIHNILKAHNEISNPTAYRRLGLRYINHFPLEENPQRVFRWVSQPELSNQGELVLSTQQVVVNKGRTGFQSVVIAFPQINIKQSKVMVLDIEQYLQFVKPVQPNLTNLEEWVVEAHEQVWHTFAGAITKEFYEELK